MQLTTSLPRGKARLKEKVQKWKGRERICQGWVQVPPPLIELTLDGDVQRLIYGIIKEMTGRLWQRIVVGIEMRPAMLDSWGRPLCDV